MANQPMIGRSDRSTRSAERRSAPPVDGQRLEQFALAYVARFATSAGRLAGYLTRKVAQRGWSGEGEPAEQVDALVSRFVAAGYVDDAAFARARSAGLLRRGYGRQRIDQALRGAGLDEDARADGEPSEGDARLAALRLAAKRGFGPFGAGPRPDRARRDKQIAAMLRAGHPFDSARQVIDAATVAEARRWAGEDGE